MMMLEAADIMWVLTSNHNRNNIRVYNTKLKAK